MVERHLAKVHVARSNRVTRWSPSKAIGCPVPLRSAYFQRSRTGQPNKKLGSKEPLLNSSCFDKLARRPFLKKGIFRKGGRVVDCIGFENRRNFTVTEGSNPSLSVLLSFFSIFIFGRKDALPVCDPFGCFVAKRSKE